MGAGKSTIGRLLAKELRVPFKDSDKEIEQRTGANIPWIFDVEGEQGFREREQAVIADLSAGEALVLATGGGAVLREANRHNLRDGGRVVYLHASVDQQIERTARDRNRPLLQRADPAQVLLPIGRCKPQIRTQAMAHIVTIQQIGAYAAAMQLMLQRAGQRRLSRAGGTD